MFKYLFCFFLFFFEGISSCRHPGSLLHLQGADQEHPQQLPEAAGQSRENGRALQRERQRSAHVWPRAQVLLVFSIIIPMVK